jgi:hypothetical protein
MNRPEDEIEAVPVFLHPLATGGRSFRIVIQLEPRANFQAGIGAAQFVDFIEIDPGMIAIVIGKRDIGQPALPRTIDPRLKQRARVGLNAMALGVGVVIGKELRVNR